MREKKSTFTLESSALYTYYKPGFFFKSLHLGLDLFIFLEKVYFSNMAPHII